MPLEEAARTGGRATVADLQRSSSLPIEDYGDGRGPAMGALGTPSCDSMLAMTGRIFPSLRDAHRRSRNPCRPLQTCSAAPRCLVRVAAIAAARPWVGLVTPVKAWVG